MIPTCTVAVGPRDASGVAASCGEPAAFEYGSYPVCYECASEGKYHDRYGKGPGYLGYPRAVKPFEDLDPIFPYAGMPATVRIGSDRYAGTVAQVSRSGYKLVVQLDKATRTDTNGMSDSQVYTYERDPKGLRHTFYRNLHGYSNPMRETLWLGTRESFHDYSF